jgi:hypothetical protein
MRDSTWWQGSDAGSPRLDQALVGGQPQTVGQFRFFIDDERWEWSDEVQQMHGYAPGTLPNPTTEQVLAHKHPDDYAHVVSALEVARRERSALSTRHRMIDTTGQEHLVVLVAVKLRDDAGKTIGTDGFYIDITPVIREHDKKLTQAVEEFSANRAVIERAKGMLMLLYGVDDEGAFEILRWRSQETNVKVRWLAERLVAEYGSIGSEELPKRVAYDNLLMTIHERLPEAGEAHQL